MTHVSRKRLDQSSDQLLNKLSTSLFSKLSASEVQQVFGAIISDTELTMIKKRVGIILFLELGLSIDEICNITKTTRQTVTRIQLLWKMADDKNKKLILKRIKRVFTAEMIKDFLANVNISRSNFRRKLARI